MLVAALFAAQEHARGQLRRTEADDHAAGVDGLADQLDEVLNALCSAFPAQECR